MENVEGNILEKSILVGYTDFFPFKTNISLQTKHE
jgi:hypothetical protein